jgi:RNA polymerase sigma-70 factor, ECF subfamily
MVMNASKTFEFLANETALAAQAAVEPDAFATIYDHYFSRVFTYIRARVNDDQSADDLTAQVFERALTKISRYQPEQAPFGAWLFGIARNSVNNHLRAERRRRWLSLDFIGEKPAEEPRPEETVMHNEAQESLWAALRTLRDQEKELVLLKYVAGLSTRQIGEMTGLSESNVSVILFRAREQLKARLKETPPAGQPRPIVPDEKEGNYD